MFRFAHISDLHLPPPSTPRVRSLQFKQILAFWSWTMKRKYLHRYHVIEAGLRALCDFAPDHLCLTGDLVNLALPEEIDQATGWLRAVETLGMTCTLVPGNHDALVRPAVAHFMKAWAPWMGMGGGGPAKFPYVMHRGPAAFIGLSSAVPTAPGMAWGEVDRDQVEALEPLLKQAAAEKRFRVLLIHHPPALQNDSPRRRLRRSGPLLDLLERQGVELILHGHLPRATRTTLAGPNGGIPVCGAGSFSLGQQPNTGHFFGFGLQPEGSQLRLSVDRFKYEPATDAFVEVAADPASTTKHP
jgi:3',5'-cyclic AMP phosphodiesterase CpdA